MMSKLKTIFLLVAVVATGYWYAQPGPDPEEESARALRKSLIRSGAAEREPLTSVDALPRASRLLRMDGEDWREHYSRPAASVGRRGELREALAEIADDWQNLDTAGEGVEVPDARDYLEVVRILAAEMDAGEDPDGPDMATLPEWE